MNRLRPLVTVSALLLGTWMPLQSQAHDTWFAASSTDRAGDWQLLLGTGERFPRHEFALTAASLARQGCQHGDAAPVPMRVGPAAPRSLHLHANPTSGARRGQSAAVTCWAELQPQDITIEPALVQVYLDEIAAPASLREAWRELQRRGLPWVERYTKHARVELLDRRLGGGDAPPARPAPMGMDIVREGPLETQAVGDTLRFRVLRDGQPLAGQAIEARSSLSPIGLWVRTDEQGRAAVRLPLAGAWLLRGTDLRLSTVRANAWESRFVTLAFDVAPRSR